ncbi:MAG: hypothetical protein ABIQ13_05980 [Pedococcus sp.]
MTFAAHPVPAVDRQLEHRSAEVTQGSAELGREGRLAGAVHPVDADADAVVADGRRHQLGDRRDQGGAGAIRLLAHKRRPHRPDADPAPDPDPDPATPSGVRGRASRAA